MRAAMLTRPGGPLEVREVEVPEPGPGQVLVRVRASGVCHTDLYVAAGILPAELPRTLGHEPAGEIAAVGSGVAARRIGDRVGVLARQGACGRCEPCARDRADSCAERRSAGVQVHGGHAEYMLATADSTVLLPEGLADEQAAPLLCAGQTVWSGLLAAAPRPGERVAVVGIGGLGHLAIQYARAGGFETFAVSRSPDKAESARQLGADDVMADGRALQRAGGADVVLVTGISYRALDEVLRALRPDGRLVLLGLSAEPLPVSSDFVLRRGRILGVTPGGREHLHEALALAARGRVRVMAETYPLARVARAYDRLAAGKVRFRAVLLP